MKNKTTFSQRFWSVLLAVVLVVTMLQCTLFTAVASDETIDSLIAAVNADSAVTLDDADEINKIVLMYDALTDKTAYESTVPALQESLYNLISDGLDLKTTEKTQFTKDDWSIFSNAYKSVRMKYTGGTNPTCAAGPHSQGKINEADAPTLDGLEVVINNYYRTQDAPRAGFDIQYTPWLYANSSYNNEVRMINGTWKLAGMILHFDLIKGEIVINSRLTNVDDVKVGTLALDEAEKAKLTLENFSHKVISIGMHATGVYENPYEVVVKLSGDSTPITALIPAEYFAEATMTTNGKVNVAFPAGYWTSPTTFPNAGTDGNIYTQFDIIGYRNKPLNALIAAVKADNAVTLDDADEINKIGLMYDALAENDKTEYKDRVEDLKTQLYNLMSDGLDVKTTKKTQFTKDDWSIISEAYNSVRMKYTGGTNPTCATGPHSQDKTDKADAPALDGLEVVINNYYRTQDAPRAGFDIQYTPWVYTNSVSSNEVRMVNGAHTMAGMILHFDLIKGEIVINSRLTSTGDIKVGTLALDEAEKAKLTLENFSHKVISIVMDATEDANNPYQVTIKVSGDTTPITALIPAEYFAEATMTTNGKVNVAFPAGYWTSPTTFPNAGTDGNIYTQFDIIGYKFDKGVQVPKDPAVEKIEELIAAVNADNAVTLDDADEINQISLLFDTLANNDKAALQVTVDALKTSLYNLMSDGLDVKTTAKTQFTLDFWSIISNAFNSVRMKYTGGTNPTCSVGPHSQGKTDKGEAPVLNGLEVVINNYYRTQDAPRAGFDIQYTPWVYTNSGSSNEVRMVNGAHTMAGMILHFDLIKGEVVINSRLTSTGDVKVGTLALDEAEKAKLTLENFSHKVISIVMDATEDSNNPYQVTIKVSGDSTPITALIPAEYFAEETMTNNGRVNVAFPAGYWKSSTAFPNAGTDGNIYTQFDIIGYKFDKSKAPKDPTVQKIEEFVAAVNSDNTVTLDDADEINRIGLLFDTLSNSDKATLQDTVDALKASLYDLLSDGLEVKTTQEEQFSQDYWSILSNSYNSVRMKYTSGNNPTCSVGPLSQGTEYTDGAALDGFEVVINNYYQTQSAPRAGFDVQFTPWVMTSTGASNEFRMVNGAHKMAGMILHFDLIKKEIVINSRLTATSDILVGTLALDEAEKAKLTLENIAHKAISIGMEATKDAENPYKVTIKISGDSTPIITYIPAEYFDEETMTEAGKVNVGFPAGYWTSPTTFPSPATDGNIYTQFDIIGYKNNKTFATVILPVIEAIDALPTNITLEDEAQIRTVREMYRALMKKSKKAKVTNYSKLEKAFSDLSALWDKNGIDPYEFEMPEVEEIEVTEYAAGAPSVSATPLSTKDSGSDMRDMVIAFGGVLALSALAITVRRIKVKEEEI